jgi:ribosomal protein S18 acetylase RimI-like enzyme
MRYLTSAEGVSADQLRGFFAGWPNPPSPETHLAILRRSAAVVLAVDDATGQVIGFVNALSDGVLSAFIPLLEVLPAYQGAGIGAELVRRLLAQLDDLYAVDLLCDAEVQPFYARLGLQPAQGMLLRRYDRQAGERLPPSFQIQPLNRAHQRRAADRIARNWGSELVVVHGQLFRPAELPGFVAVDGDEWLGLLTYHSDGDSCEIVTLDTNCPNQGIGTALIEAVRRTAQQAGCRRLWLVTTNDNTAALRFYQKRGFSLAALHANAVARSRQIKPEIPLTGNDGIPIRDEIEMEMWL